MFRATVKTNSSVKQYIGETEGTIKQRIYSPKLSFTNRNYSTNTSLSTHIWCLKDINISSTITWEILKLALAYNKTKKMPSLPLQKNSNYHPPHHKTFRKKKIRNSIQMPTWETNIYSHISTYLHNPSLLPIPPALLYIPPQVTPPTHHKYHLPPLNLYIHLHALPRPVSHYVSPCFHEWLLIGLYTVYLTYPPHTHHLILQ